MKKKQDLHNKAIDNWDAIFENRQRFLDAGIGDEFKDWERDLKRMIEEQSKLDALSDEFDAKGEDIAQMRKNMKEKRTGYENQIDRFDGQLELAHKNIVLPDIDQHFRHSPNWEGYQLPSREWCEWIDNLETYMKKRNNDEDMLVHEKEETEWFDKMHPQCEALDTFYPAEEDEEDEEEEEEAPAALIAGLPAPMAATTSNQQLRKRLRKKQRRGEK